MEVGLAVSDTVGAGAEGPTDEPPPRHATSASTSSKSTNVFLRITRSPFLGAKSNRGEDSGIAGVLAVKPSTSLICTQPVPRDLIVAVGP
jgi:hypothetical protein